MDVGIAQFWGGIAVIALASVVNIIITLYKASKASADINKQIEANDSNIKENIKANMSSLEKTIEANINSVEKELKTKIGVEVLSKYRQEWINQLRQVMTSILIQNDQLNRSITMKKGDSSLVLNTTSEINNKYCFLILLLNPIENNHIALLRLTRKFMKEIFNINAIFVKIKTYKENMHNLSDHDKKIEDNKISENLSSSLNKLSLLKKLIIRKTQKILKEEWNRVKEGK